MSNNFYLEKIIETLESDLTYKNVYSKNKLCLFLEQVTYSAKLGHITLDQADTYIDRAFCLYESLPVE